MSSSIHVFFLVSMWIASFVHGSPCPALYKRYSQHHTYCRPNNTNCHIHHHGITNEQKVQIVQEHNKYRSRVAMGQETTGHLPPATNMLQMEWDDELAAVAQAHANQCEFKHDCNECRQIENFDAGQNLYMSWGGPVDRNPDWKAAIKAWYDEVKDFNRNTINSYDPRLAGRETGHLTQMIWAKTWKVGCGYTFHMKGPTPHKLYTCNYGPSGNVLTNQIYKGGAACSECPTNTFCNKDEANPGLCHVPLGSKPKQPRAPGNYIYYCDFEKESNCNIGSSAYLKSWQVINTLSGSYASITLKGGETSLLNFKSPIKALPEMCVSISYRKGPNIAGQLAKHEAKEHFYLTKMRHNMEFTLQSNARTFSTFGMNLNFNSDLLFSISFSVPKGSPDQYLDIKDVFAKSGRC